MLHVVARCALCVLALVFGLAEASSGERENARQVFTAARAAATDGPGEIKLMDQAVLKLPAGYFFVGEPHASKVLHVMGNPGNNPRLQGLIFPEKGDWFMTVQFEKAGYVKDDEARDWNADDLLKSYREGTEKANEERVKNGDRALEILGWAEKPAYDSTAHRLVWAMSSREKGASASEPQGVNYNTYALGRDGYFSMNLVTALKDLDADKPAARTLLSVLEFNQGKRYSDFNASTDKVAEYGLAALVAGVAAKKLGLFALALAFVAKFAKLAILGVFAFGGVAFKFFKRGKENKAEPAEDPGA
jgi:uncharacterized membrane-anchored protein